jgi:transcriptional repressor NrdR
MDVRVLKTNGKRELFHRGKLYRSVMVAGAKRDIESGWAESAVNDIENKILEGGQSEVSSKLIAEMVMERLVTLDEVAYVRYASSYFEEGGISEMLDVINEARRRRERTEIERTNLRLVPSDTPSQE